MKNEKYGIAHRILAAFLALVLVFGTMPVSAIPVHAATEEHPDAVTISVVDAEGNPVEGASVSYTINSVVNGDAYIAETKTTDENGVVEVLAAADFVAEDLTLSAAVTKDGYENGSVAETIASADQNFTVTLAAVVPEIDDVIITFAENLTYDGKAHALVEVEAKKNDTVTYKLNGVEVTKEKLRVTDAGNYKVTVTVARDGYKSLVKEADVNVAQAEITGVELKAIENLVYNGENQQLVTVKGYEDTDEISWTVNGEPTGSKEIPERLFAGTYTVVLTVKRGDNYKDLSIDVKATINQADIDLNGLVIKGLNGVYTGEEQEAVIIESRGEGYTLWYQLADVDDQNQPVVNDEAWSQAIPKVKDAGSYVVLVMATTDDKNYKDTDYKIERTEDALPYNVYIAKAPQSLTFTNPAYTDGESTNVIFSGAALEYDFGTTVTEVFKDNQVVYSFGEGTTEGIATIAADGKVTVTGAGVVVVVATLPGDDNIETASVSHTLLVTQEVSEENKLIRFAGDVTYILGEKNGVASAQGAEKTRWDDYSTVTYSIDNKDVGLTIGDDGIVTVSDYKKLSEAMAMGGGSIQVVVTANKDEYIEGRGFWSYVKYGRDSASYTLTISFLATPEDTYVLSGTNGSIDDVATGWYVSNVTAVPAIAEGAEESAYTISQNCDPNGFGASVVFADQGEHERIVYLRSKETGGITAPISVMIKIDTKAPEAPEISYSESVVDAFLKMITCGFYQPNVTVTIKAQDATSGIDHFNYSYDVEEGASAVNKGGIGVLTANDGTVTFEIPAQFRGYVSATATDKAGNVSASTTDEKLIIVDSIAPQVSVSYNEPFNAVDGKAYYNVDVNVTITVNEANFFAEDVIVKMSKNAGKEQDVPTDWTVGPDTSVGTFTIKDDGHYIVTIQYTDKSGNYDEEKSYYKSYEIIIDKTAPVIGFAYDPGNQEATITVTEHNFRASEMMLDVVATNIKGEDVATTDLLAFLQNEENWTVSEENADIRTLVLDSTGENKELLDAIYQLTINYTDLATNSADEVESGEFVVDHTAPVDIDINYSKSVIDQVLSALSLGFYKPDVTITFTAYDITSGVKEFNWAYNRDEGVSGANLESASGKLEAVQDAEDKSKFTASIKLPQEEADQLRGHISVEAVDNCGNSSEKTDDENVVIVDTIAPVIDVAYNDPVNEVNGEAFYRGDVNVTITVKEANFFAEDVKVTVSKEGEEDTAVTPIWGEGADDETDGIFTTQGTFTIQGDGHYTVTVAYTDKCGNVAETYTSHRITIDTIAPRITVTYDENDVANGKYFKELRTATITIVEHNFNWNDVNFIRNAARGGVNPDIERNSVGDTHTAIIRYTVDGDYTFDVNAQDLARNNSGAADYSGCVAGTDFVIDTDDDMITIGGVEKGVAYGYDAEVIPTIEVSDINLDKVEVTLVGQQKGNVIDLTEQVKALLNSTAENVTGSFDIFEVIQDLDGIYTLTVSALDKANNPDEDSVTFTVNRFGSVYEYEKDLMDLLEQTYTQDVTKDLIINEYNADKLADGTVQIEITRDGKPLENVIFSVSPEVNDMVELGQSGWYQYKYTISKDNFLEDGVYKITVSSKDKTGNASENTSYEDLAIIFYVDSTAAEITSIAGLEDPIINATEQVVKYTVYDSIGLKSIVVYVDDVIVANLAGTDFGDDYNNYSGSFTLTEKNSAQRIRIVVEDLAGNKTDTDPDDFVCAYEFNKSVTVSTNIFVRWYANKGLFWGSIGGGIAGIGGLGVFLASKRKKKEENAG